jgi:murein DD-endopeptidase MepM/ murein hydrolase activator NlpD
MNIILMQARPGRVSSLTLRRWQVLATILLLLGALPVGAGYLGYRLAGARVGIPPHKVQRVTVALQAELASQRKELSAAREDSQAQMDGLAIRLGDLQAQMMRLNALGERLTKVADLGEGEFDFSNPPPQGGPLRADAAQSMGTAEFEQALDRLAERLDQGQRQLEVLSDLLLTRNVSAQLRPSGNPVKNGWLSSPFGKRTDPLTGKTSWHDGVDIVGKVGTVVAAAASGVVTFAGVQDGYGNLVEVAHGNGLKTRYGHNQKLLVGVGDVVKRGDALALLGSSGRATGPHVHFEVLDNGKATNPAKYLQAQR